MGRLIVAPRSVGQERGGVKPLVAACAVLAVASVLLLPCVPSFDPYSWLTWGREVFHPGAYGFDTSGGPSWKPLPVVFTAVFGLFGGASPTLWLVLVQTGGLLALCGAFRLASRLAGPGAGAVAALALFFTADWPEYMQRGASEPLLAACVLWAILAHLDQHRRWAYTLAVGVALVRPEGWPFLGLYAIFLWRKERRAGRAMVVAGLALIPLLWLVPPWIAEGRPFESSTNAKFYDGHLGDSPALEVLRRGGELTTVPVLLLAAAGIAFALRRRERLVQWLIGLIVLWAAVVVVLTLRGYPGLGRFMLPSITLLCVIAGCGAVWLVRAVGRGRGAATTAAALLLLSGSTAFSLERIRSLSPQERNVSSAVSGFHQLDLAIAAAGGRENVLRCAAGYVGVNHSTVTALAWKLRVPVAVVRPWLRHAGLYFRAPYVPMLGKPGALQYRPRRLFETAHAGVWRVITAVPPGHRPTPQCS